MGFWHAYMGIEGGGTDGSVIVPDIIVASRITLTTHYAEHVRMTKSRAINIRLDN